MTVEELLGRMTSREIAEWMAYDRIDPFGEIRAEMRNGLLIANMLGMFAKTPPKPADYMIDFEKMAKPVDIEAQIEAQKARFMQYALAHGTVRLADGTVVGVGANG